MDKKTKAMIALRASIADQWEPFYTCALGSACDVDWARLSGAYACVYHKGNGRFQIFVNEDMVDEPLDVLQYEVKHELWHVLLGHLTNRFHSVLFADSERANVAQDIALNCCIQIPDKIAKERQTAEVWKVDPDKTTEFYYHALEGNTKLPNLKEITLEELMQMIKNGEKVNFKFIDTIKGKPLEEHEMQEVMNRIGQLAGAMPGDLLRALNRERGINFQMMEKMMRNMVDPDGNKGIKKTWAYANRRNPTFRGKVRRMMARIFLILDSSGSITQQQLNVFAGTLHSLSEYCKIFVAVTDAQVHEKFWFKGHLSKVTGGGGTVFHDAFKLAEEMRFTNIAILTDGYCDYPDKTTAKQVLWGIIENKEFKPKFGNVIHLK